MEASDLFVVAMSRYKRQKYDECIELCNEFLQRNARDQAIWLLKCRALTQKNWVDDLEIEEEGVADLLMDENAVANAPRPGTSLEKPLTGSQGASGISPMIRPISGTGRPITGFSRPGTNRPVTGSKGALQNALSGNRPTTSSRPVTSGGRYLRLGTASMLEQGDKFIISEKLNPKNVNRVRPVARAVCNYLLYFENNAKKALEISLEGNSVAGGRDWWWLERLGKCYFKLGLLRDAEKMFQSSLDLHTSVDAYLELAKIAIRQDQPGKAIEIYNKALMKFPNELPLLISLGRIFDLINDPAKSTDFYKKALMVESCNVESIASLAAYHFYTDQPEVALRFYRRLVQLGVNNSELWNNMGLCSYYAGQYDVTLSCFEKALDVADDTNLADIWYNISHVAVGIGDLNLAYEALKIAISADPNHAEAFNNLGVLELRKGNIDQAKANFSMSSRQGPFLFEPAYNGGLVAYRTGEYQDSYVAVQKSLEAYPDHTDSKELLKMLQKCFSKD